MKKVSILFSIMLPMSMTAHAKVLHVSKFGFIVENQISTDKTPTKVWLALTRNVDSWWPKDHTWWEGVLSIEAKAGGCFCEVSETKSAEHMRISFVEPNKLLRMSGGLGPLQGMGMFGALDWQIRAVDGGSEVTLSYKVSGVNPDGYAQLAPIVAQVQGIQLNGLKSFLEKNQN